MRQSCRPSCAEVERREIGRLELGEILLEQLMDMGSCALHDRLEPAEPYRDQFPNTGLHIRRFVDHRSGSKHTTPKKANKMAPDRRQSALLLPLPGGRKRNAQAVADPTTPAARRRKQATV